MISLVQLANEKRLPDHQYMDSQTLDWIRKNKPDGYSNSLVKRVSFTTDVVEILSHYSPETDWFLEPDIINSIHGLRHVLRCLAHTSILSKRVHFSAKETSEVLIAISLHDCRRTGDKNDSEHGKRASEWFIANLTTLQIKWKQLAGLNVKKIAKIIELHEVPYTEFKTIEESYLPLINVLKTADALDRYRQPKLKWRINEKYIKLQPTKIEKFFAYNLVIKSENRYLSNNSSYLSVINTVSEYVSH